MAAGSKKVSKDTIDKLFDYDFHLETRTIYLGDSEEEGVSPMMAERAIKALHLLSEHKDEPIKIILNTQGGCYFSGMAVYDAVKACPCHIIIEVIGSAQSMGSIILQAADERVIHPNAIIMIHDGEDGFSGHPKNLERAAELSKKIRKKTYDIYAEKSKHPAHYWEKKCAFDTFYSAEQAKEEGLVDKIYGEEDEHT